MEILASIGVGFLAIAVVVGVLILRAQKRIDAPYGGIMVVEKQEGEPSLVYFQAMADPGTYTDGQELKLKVRIMEVNRQ